MLLTKEVEVKPCAKTLKRYKDLGYDAKVGVPLIVRVEELTKGSHVIVEALCDYCHNEILRMTYNDYNYRIKHTNKIACFNCKSEKTRETCLDMYGVDNYMKTKEGQQKAERTMLERYGVRRALQNNEFIDKARYTRIERYGEDFGKIITNKAFDTFYKRTGYHYPMQSPEAMQKSIDTLMENYGVDRPLKSTEIHEKVAQTFYENSSQKASRQQRYICNLYHGVLNAPFMMYNLDVYLPDEKIDVEFDGSGHTLSYELGYITEEEFKRRNIFRNVRIKDSGIKQMRIISSKDLLPSDTTLLQMLDDARSYFDTYPNHSWIEFNIDTSTVRNAEHKDGVFFDFGELRKIHKSDISDDDAA